MLLKPDSLKSARNLCFRLTGVADMKGQTTGPVLSTIFVDYDNIYLSLKRKNDEAAKRFAKDAHVWLKEIESGRLITPTNGATTTEPRRIVMNRCYGNPVPRRNSSDNSTDMNSFPFVRHHFLRAGVEAVDCPPLTSQLKNSADIRMVMDVRDLIQHDTYFDEFIILSGDADFTPLLHRLRAHARRTVVFANDHTAAPYTAIADGEIRESSLIALLLEGRAAGTAEPNNAPDVAAQASSAQLEVTRKAILNEVIALVRSAGQPVPLEALADRAVRTLGHDRTVGTSWGGAGSFSSLLAKGLPEDIRLSEQPPYYVYDTSRSLAGDARRSEPVRDPVRHEPVLPGIGRSERNPVPSNFEMQPAPAAAPQVATYDSAAVRAARMAPMAAPAPAAAAPVVPKPTPRAPEGPTIQQSITRIHEACQAPPLAPPEYRVLFDVMAQEINANNLSGSQTLINIAQRAAEQGVEVRRDDIRFVLDVVSETDPWFEQGASASLFASRFRNFVVARCRSQNLSLSSEELDLIDAWFGGSPAAQRAPLAQSQVPARTAAPTAPAPAPQADRWWSADEGRAYGTGGRMQYAPDDELPLIVRNRNRG